ncbi:MAG TPA: YetF domain-containing protein [Sphingomicrobium sp.]|nr:YetF domain-containing protein [Sphingomicrobium sp.]
MFDLPVPFDTLARGLVLTTAALLWVVVLVRVVGLRSFSKMTAFDFVATVATGSLLAAGAAAASWQAYAQVMIAMAALLAAQVFLALMRRKSEKLRALMSNTPTLLMENGEFCEPALRMTRVAREDVLAKIRTANALNLADIRAVVLETTGDISVLHGNAVDEELLKGVKRVGQSRD